MKTQVLERHAHPKHPRLSVQLRTNTKFFQAVIWLDGTYKQHSLKTTHLPTAFRLT